MNNKKNNQSKKHLRNWLLALIALVLLVVLAVWPTDYYIEYPEFQQNYYWSSAAGIEADYRPVLETWWNRGENPNHARATKAYINNGKFAYYPSSVGDDGNSKERPMYEDAGRDNGNSGRANRKTALRIRAARIDAEPQ